MNYCKNKQELISRAQEGDMTAQFDLALFYWYGVGTPEDHKQGRGVAQDRTQAEYWFEQAAKQGCKDAQEWVEAIRQGDAR